jgi:hypothetical protein
MNTVLQAGVRDALWGLGSLKYFFEIRIDEMGCLCWNGKPGLQGKGRCAHLEKGEREGERGREKGRCAHLEKGEREGERGREKVLTDVKLWCETNTEEMWK